MNYTAKIYTEEDYSEGHLETVNLQASNDKEASRKLVAYVIFNAGDKEAYEEVLNDLAEDYGFTNKTSVSEILDLISDSDYHTIKSFICVDENRNVTEPSEGKEYIANLSF